MQHGDQRVARTAWNKLGIRIDQWSNLPLLQQQAQIEHLVKQLSQLPSSLPEDNQILVRSLAAKLYSLCVTINDPQLQATMAHCQRLFSPGHHQAISNIAMDDLIDLRGPKTVLPAPEPVPTGVANRLQQTQVLPPEQPESDTTLISPALHDTSFHLSVSNTAQVAGTTISSELAKANRYNQPTASSSKPELPALAKTPASVASYALPGIKQSSEIPDLGEVTKIEIAELVRLLASDNPDITKAATLALRNHGLSDCRIELASELATGSAVRRMELIQQLAVSPDLDPRPWLVWMAEDGQPEVRRLAVSLLSSMLDPEIERSMRMLLFREQDEPTRDQIRKVLLSASK
jgi:hypothetical protein